MLRRKALRACLTGLLVVACLCLPTPICQAEGSALPELTTKPTTIAVFKNGLGFFIREGVASLADGWAVTSHVPSPALGSLWIASLDDEATLEEVVGFEEEIESETEANSLQDLLVANVGKRVSLVLGDEIIEGTIKSVPADRQPEQQDAARDDYRSSYLSSQPQAQPGSLLIVETEGGDVALSKNSISRIESVGPLVTSFTTVEKKKRIKFKVASAKDTTGLRLAYLQKGITWVPSYLVDIRDPGKASVTLKATVVNDAEDLEDVDLIFVVGYPSFAYANVLSPMALRHSISQFMAELEGGGGRSGQQSALANIMSQRVTFGSDDRPPGSPPDYAASTGLPGESQADLFLYHKAGVTLKRWERAYYQVFIDEIDYEHVYEWDIPDTMNVDPSGYHRSGSIEDQREQVWHSLKLTNQSVYPWTTAPAFVVSDWKPLAQGTIDYTPTGTSTNLKMTVATDIKTDRNEREIAREREVTLYRRSYDLVTVRGELYINNRKDESVTIEIKKYLTGDVSEASHHGEVLKTVEGLRGVNPKSTISWRIIAGPGEPVALGYEYQVYVAN